MDDKANEAFVNKRQDFKNQAKKLEQEGRILSAKAAVVSEKKRLVEAEEDYTEAAADDLGLVTVPEEGTEAARTRTLVEQAKIDLAQAEEELKELEKQGVPKDDEPSILRTPTATEPRGGEPVSSRQPV